MNEIDEFVYMSKYAGMREDLVQAGGGNTSVKLINNEMLIKASGYQLSDVSHEVGYSRINYKVIQDFFENIEFEKITSELGKDILEKSIIEGERPSIETFLHAITNKYTLHTHPVVVNVLTSRIGGMEILQHIFPDALMVDYATPGINLAKKYYKSYENGNNSNEVVFLKNHGLIISGESAEYVIEKTEDVICKIEKHLKIDRNIDRESTEIYTSIRKICSEFSKIVYKSNDMDVNRVLKNNKFEIWNYEFCPDNVVFCGKKVLMLDEESMEKTISMHIKNYNIPVLIIYKKHIFIVAENIRKAKEIESVLRFSALVSSLNNNYSMDLLSEAEQNFLLNWDSEKYRQQIK